MRALILAAILLATPAAARDLAVPPDKGWQHAASGVTLKRTLIGLPRTALTDSGADELDIAAQFEDAAHDTALTIFVFRPAASGAALWFDRSMTALERRAVWGGVRPLAAPTAFTPPQANSASGLRAAFTTGKGPYASTALAVAPVGKWLVAIRLSSKTLDATALNAKLSEAISAIGWPAATGASVAVPIAACPTALNFGKAKQKKPDMTQALLGSLIAGVAAGKAADKGAEPLKPLCRDGQPTEYYGVYRAADVTDGYLLALGDSGTTASVYKTFKLDPKAGDGWAVALNALDGSVASYPEFDRLPAPQQVFDTVLKTAPISRASANGRDISISNQGK